MNEPQPPTLPRDSRWRFAGKVALLLYAALLTAGLLAPNPFAAAGQAEGPIRRFYFQRVEWCAHWLGLTLLSLLCLASCRFSALATAWKAWLILGLLVYAIGTEAAQGLVPSRTVQWQDFAQNIAGVLSGVAVYYIAIAARPKPRPANI